VAQNKSGVNYRDEITRAQRNEFAFDPRVRAVLGEETTAPLPVCESLIPPSVQLLLFGYVLAPDGQFITPEMIFAFKAQRPEFFEQCKINRQIALDNFLRDKPNGGDHVMVNDITYVFLNGCDSNWLQIPVIRCLGGILPGVTLEKLQPKELRAISMAFAEERAAKAPGELEIIRRILLLNRVLSYGSYPKHSASDLWLVNPNSDNMRLIIAPAGNLGDGAYIAFDKAFLERNKSKVVLCERTVIFTANGLRSPHDNYNTDAYCLAFKADTGNKYGMQMNITPGQDIGIRGPGFTCNNACGDNAMFGFEKNTFLSDGEGKIFHSVVYDEIILIEILLQ